MIICCEICKTSSYICIEVNDKHRDCPPNVMTQNTEYFGLYRYSHIPCDVTPTSRINTDHDIMIQLLLRHIYCNSTGNKAKNISMIRGPNLKRAEQRKGRNILGPNWKRAETSGNLCIPTVLMEFHFHDQRKFETEMTFKTAITD